MLRFYTINAAFLVILSLMLLFIDVSPWLYLLFVLIWIIITIIGSFQIKLNYHLRSLNHNYSTPEKAISITIDDSPNPEFTLRVLKMLKKYNAKSTFFVIAQKAEKQPGIIQKIVEDGHTIGNHSYSHSKNFGFFSTQKVIEELNLADEVFKNILGIRPLMFRPPFGVTNPNIRKALQKTRHVSVGWSKRSLDTTKISEERIFKRITANLKKGDIVLLHDSSEKSLDVLERFLIFLQTHDLQSVTVDKLLEIKAYE